ncbi:MAG: DUF502 domain-containing protein [Candidatus Gygaella obscura]|nr:DUF502 domain-containing protein [Candidatus Gygaella obscura]
MKNTLRKHFLTGLLAVVPVFLTIYVLVIIFQFIDNLTGRFINSYIRSQLGFYIPGLGFIIFFIFIFLVGFVANILIGRRMFLFFEKWFKSLPFVNKIYPAFKQIVSFLLQQQESKFKKVVLVEYPRKGIWSIGFLTNDNTQTFLNEVGKDLVSIFIPSSPGPLTGYVLFFPREELKFLDISVTDALKVIFSGGIIRK